jgi:hypothetical protein
MKICSWSEAHPLLTVMLSPLASGMDGSQSGTRHPAGIFILREVWWGVADSTRSKYYSVFIRLSDVFYRAIKSATLLSNL